MAAMRRLLSGSPGMRVGAAVVLGVADGDARGPAVPEDPAADVGQPGGEPGNVVVLLSLQRGGQLSLQQFSQGSQLRLVGGEGNPLALRYDIARMKGQAREKAERTARRVSIPSS